MLTVNAVATMNPDIDRLRQLELFEQGDVVAHATSTRGAQKLALSFRVKATHGTWFVLKASGEDRQTQPGGSAGGGSVVALSAPIYVYVDHSGFCKPTAVPGVVTDLKEQLRKIVSVDVAKEFELEPSITLEPRTKYWSSQKDLLQKRINTTNRIYDDILDRAGHQRCLTDGIR